jgi:hypothetical protein
MHPPAERLHAIGTATALLATKDAAKRYAALATILDEGRALTDIAWIRHVRQWTRNLTQSGLG